MRYFLGTLVMVCGMLGGIPYVNAQINLLAINDSVNTSLGSATTIDVDIDCSLVDGYIKAIDLNVGVAGSNPNVTINFDGVEVHNQSITGTQPNPKSWQTFYLNQDAPCKTGIKPLSFVFSSSFDINVHNTPSGFQSNLTINDTFSPITNGKLRIKLNGVTELPIASSTTQYLINNDFTSLVFPLGLIILIMSITMWYQIIRKR